MKNKRIRIGGLAVGLALVGVLVFSVAAFAYGSGNVDSHKWGRGIGIQGEWAGMRGNSDTFGMALGIGMRGEWAGPQNSLVAIVAETLGIEQADLVAQLQDGETLADVAGDQVDEIVDALLAARADMIAAQVENGRLTQEQADLVLETMKSEITEHLNSPFSPRGFGLGDGTHMGPGFVDADGDGVCDQSGSADGQYFHGGRGMRGGRWSR